MSTELQFKPITVSSQVDGQKVAATLAVCSCGSERFHAYRIGHHSHLHLQCLACGDSYCSAEGPCHAGPARNTDGGPE